MNEELVSIIMPSYNTANYIMNSIQSVLNQTYKNWELIIVDDCSSDDTLKLLSNLNDARIKVLVNEKNSGAAISRNKALKAANGKWIAFLDSDDLWESNKLEKQINFMEQNDYHFSYTKYKEIDSNSEPTGVVVSGPKIISKHKMFNFCWPGCLTVMYDRKKVGLIQIADIKKNNDYAMWLQVSKKEKCYLLDECLAMYRKGRKGSISTHGYLKLIKWHYKLFREAEKKNAISSIYYTIKNMFFGIVKKLKYVKRH